jgi:hypothetical protein
MRCLGINADIVIRGCRRDFQIKDPTTAGDPVACIILSAALAAPGRPGTAAGGDRGIIPWRQLGDPSTQTGALISVTTSSLTVTSAKRWCGWQMDSC